MGIVELARCTPVQIELTVRGRRDAYGGAGQRRDGRERRSAGRLFGLRSEAWFGISLL